MEIHLRITARYAGGKGGGQGVKLEPRPQVCPHLELLDLSTPKLGEHWYYPFRYVAVPLSGILPASCKAGFQTDMKPGLSSQTSGRSVPPSERGIEYKTSLLLSFHAT